MAPGTAPIPSRIEDKGIQKPDNEITDITNGALRGNYGERFVQYSLRGCYLNENGPQSLPYRGEDHRRSHNDNEAFRRCQAPVTIADIIDGARHPMCFADIIGGARHRLKDLRFFNFRLQSSVVELKMMWLWICALSICVENVNACRPLVKRMASS